MCLVNLVPRVDGKKRDPGNEVGVLFSVIIAPISLQVLYKPAIMRNKVLPGTS